MSSSWDRSSSDDAGGEGGDSAQQAQPNRCSPPLHSHVACADSGGCSQEADITCSSEGVAALLHICARTPDSSDDELGQQAGPSFSRWQGPPPGAQHPQQPVPGSFQAFLDIHRAISEVPSSPLGCVRQGERATGKNTSGASPASLLCTSLGAWGDSIPALISSESGSKSGSSSGRGNARGSSSGCGGRLSAGRSALSPLPPQHRAPMAATTAAAAAAAAAAADAAAETAVARDSASHAARWHSPPTSPRASGVRTGLLESDGSYGGARAQQLRGPSPVMSQPPLSPCPPRMMPCLLPAASASPRAGLHLRLLAAGSAGGSSGSGSGSGSVSGGSVSPSCSRPHAAPQAQHGSASRLSSSHVRPVCRDISRTLQACQDACAAADIGSCTAEAGAGGLQGLWRATWHAGAVGPAPLTPAQLPCGAQNTWDAPPSARCAAASTSACLSPAPPSVPPSPLQQAAAELRSRRSCNGTPAAAAAAVQGSPAAALLAGWLPASASTPAHKTPPQAPPQTTLWGEGVPVGVHPRVPCSSSSNSCSPMAGGVAEAAAPQQLRHPSISLLRDVALLDDSPVTTRGCDVYAPRSGASQAAAIAAAAGGGGAAAAGATAPSSTAAAAAAGTTPAAASGAPVHPCLHEQQQRYAAIALGAGLASSGADALPAVPLHRSGGSGGTMLARHTPPTTAADDERANVPSIGLTATAGWSASLPAVPALHSRCSDQGASWSDAAAAAAGAGSGAAAPNLKALALAVLPARGVAHPHLPLGSVPPPPAARPMTSSLRRVVSSGDVRLIGSCSTGASGGADEYRIGASSSGGGGTSRLQMPAPPKAQAPLCRSPVVSMRRTLLTSPAPAQQQQQQQRASSGLLQRTTAHSSTATTPACTPPPAGGKCAALAMSGSSGSSRGRPTLLPDMLPLPAFDQLELLDAHGLPAHGAQQHPLPPSGAHPQSPSPGVRARLAHAQLHPPQVTLLGEQQQEQQVPPQTLQQQEQHDEQQQQQQHDEQQQQQHDEQQQQQQQHRKEQEKPLWTGPVVCTLCTHRGCLAYCLTSGIIGAVFEDASCMLLRHEDGQACLASAAPHALSAALAGPSLPLVDALQQEQEHMTGASGNAAAAVATAIQAQQRSSDTGRSDPELLRDQGSGFGAAGDDARPRGGACIGAAAWDDRHNGGSGSSSSSSVGAPPGLASRARTLARFAGALLHELPHGAADWPLDVMRLSVPACLGGNRSSSSSSSSSGGGGGGATTAAAKSAAAATSASVVRGNKGGSSGGAATTSSKAVALAASALAAEQYVSGFTQRAGCTVLKMSDGSRQLIFPGDGAVLLVDAARAAAAYVSSAPHARFAHGCCPTRPSTAAAQGLWGDKPPDAQPPLTQQQHIQQHQQQQQQRGDDAQSQPLLLRLDDAAAPPPHDTRLLARLVYATRVVPGLHLPPLWVESFTAAAALAS